MKLDILKSSLLKQATQLFSGSAIAAAITVGSAPIIGWLFDPRDFGLASMILSIASICLPITIGGLDKAIQIRKDPLERAQLMTATLVLATHSTMALFLIGCMALWTTSSDIEFSFLVFVIVTLLLLAIKEILKANSLAKMNYKIISHGEMLQAVVRTVLRIVAGIVTGSSVVALAISHQVGLFVMILKLKKEELGSTSNNSGAWGVKNAYGLILANSSFPKYNMTTALLAQLTRNMPVLILGIAYDPFFAGIYAMADRLVAAPVDLAGNSLRQVLVQRFIRLSSVGQTLALIGKISIALALTTGPFAVILYLYGPDVLKWIFNEKWEESGQVIKILAPLVFFKPLFAVFHAQALSGRLQKMWFNQEVWTFISRLTLVPLIFTDLITMESFLTAYVWLFIASKLMGCWKIHQYLITKRTEN